MPSRTHGKVERTLDRGLDKARRLLEKLADAGIDYDDVTETLEREGVEKFATSFAELLEGIRASERSSPQRSSLM